MAGSVTSTPFGAHHAVAVLDVILSRIGDAMKGRSTVNGDSSQSNSRYVSGWPATCVSGGRGSATSSRS
jgi:hypothetical protein